MKKTFVIVFILMSITFTNTSISNAINLDPAKLLSPGELTGSHAKLSGIKDCIKCHTLGKGITDSACLSCHDKLVERINANKGFHAGREGKCVECHTEHKGASYNIMPIEKKKFDHKRTGYELQDKHKADCNKCHKKEKTYMGLQTVCLGCHDDLHRKTLPDDCTKCHDFNGWKSLKFDHEKNSKYNLTGKHSDVKCESCHPRYPEDKSVKGAEKINLALQFKPIKNEKCDDCHFDIHKGQLKEKTCSRCHATDGWEKKSFEHNDPKLSDYKLVGKHENVSCENCHLKETVKVKSRGKSVKREVKKLKAIKSDNCSDCHFDVHKEQFKDQRCDACHTVKNEWKKNIFKHEDEKFKGFKLEGKHAKVECEKCHARSKIRFKEFNEKKTASVGKFAELKSENCNDCHFDIHKEQFKDLQCDACHIVKNKWKEHTFRHDEEQYKGYKLEGKHAKVECEKCHARSKIKFKEFNEKKTASVGKFKGLKSENCNDCHFDVHKDQFKDQRCDACHTVKNEWKKNIFKHEDKKYKGYKLEGKHAKVDCEKCHARSEVKFKEFNSEKKVSLGTFKPIKYKTCNTCHEDIHKGKYEESCNKCHAPDSWKPKDFLHDPISFELKGSHRSIGCEQCHENKQIFTGLESDCSQCHKDEHSNQFNQSCRECHKQVAWIPVNFKHTGVGFRLTGTHRILDCKDCHLSGDFRNASTDCFICHQNDYQSAPNHISSSYSNDCTECHISSVSWIETNFKHTSFSFRGAHSALKKDCATCHGSSAQLPAGTSDSECFNCHSISGVASSSYEGVSSPSHTSLGFSYSCTDCHSESTWTNARLTHQNFNLTGTHTSLNCTACHQSGYPGQYAGTTEDDCYTCHANDHAQQHPSYPQGCTQCHSSNAWLPASAHQNFNRIGVHQTLNCIDCHQSGYPGQYAGATEDDCYTCHANDHAQQHPSNPQDCTQCHSINAWLPASTHQSFNLIGIHQTLNCIDCHQRGYPGQYAGATEDDCYTCHANNHAQQHPSYPQDCTQCHSTNAWLPASAHQSFNLIGVHRTLNCIDCHQSGYPGQYAGATEDDCYTCHANNHAQQHPSYPQDCTQCHSTNAWLPASAHQSFNLIGVHRTLNCIDCHQSGYPGQYAGATEDDCYTCHANDHAQQHPSNPQDCTLCHSTNAWLPASTHQNFNLRGIHRTLSCNECHSSGYPGQYAGIGDDNCYACHESDYNSEHRGGSTPYDCTQCHNLNDFD